MERKLQNILVTGGAGFIGSAFIRYLLQQCPAFTGTCINYDLLTYAGRQENLVAVQYDVRYRFYRGDICNQPLLEHLIQEYEVDTIVHFAAESHVDNSIAAPEVFMQTNVMGTFYLLELVRKYRNIHFHHVSTDEVYGHLGDTGLFTEQTAYNPSSPYSASKAASDHLVRAYATTYGISVTLSNCSNNYGPYQFPEKLIPRTIQHCLHDKAIPIYGNGSNVRDWLYVEDHVSAIYRILLAGRSGETYNIGGEAEKRNIDLVYQLIAALAAVLGESEEKYRRLVTFVPDRAGHDYRYAIDCTKIKTELGWRALCSFEAGLEKTVRWYIDNNQIQEATR